MANEGDQASAIEELLLNVDLANARNRVLDSPVAKGECLFCEAPLDSSKRWCDKDCRDDWQKMEDANKLRRGSVMWSEDS